MKDFLKSIKEEMDLISPGQPTITVSRKDLEDLIRSYEFLKNKNKE